MAEAQKRATRTYRFRLGERGLVRFEIVGSKDDRALLRSLAKHLAESGPDAARIRAVVSRTISGQAPTTGGIVAALRRSPLVDADLDLRRPRIEPRPIDL